MIRKLQATIALLFFFVLLVQSSNYGQLEITKVSRQVNLQGGYPTETIKISFVSNGEAIGNFSYLLPLQFSTKVSKIWFSKSEKDRSSLQHQQNTLSSGGITYNQYKVKLPHNYNIGDMGDIYAHIVYLYRYINLPASITLTEDQKVQYEDTKFIVSPYHILEQEVTYKMYRIYEADQDGQKKGMSEITFSKNSIQPFTFVRHRVFGVNNNPLVQFTSVQKVIEVSHWGNLGISQHYSIVNKGPSLKGQFSRVTYGSRGDTVKNAFRGVDFDLPYEVWGLYYLDEVGNITTSRAWRDDHKNAVHVTISPRFALLGGWKSNWQLGYNLNTLGHLFHTDNKFELKNLKLEYALEKIQTQNYKIKIILPDGAQNVRIKIGGNQIDPSLIELSRSEGYLDFNGRPTYAISNYLGVFTGKNIEVQYDFDQTKVYEKIVILFVIILVFLSSAILLKRFKLQAFEQVKSD